LQYAHVPDQFERSIPNLQHADSVCFQAIYLTLFYTKREYALRIGYLFVSAAIAGSLGGILAYG
jgi:hypothetical protein